MPAVIDQTKSAAKMQITYLDALVQAQIEEMERDERVILMGENMAIYGGGKIIQRFESKRVWNMPISETSFTGVGIGAAVSGLRPIVDLTIASFMYLAADPIINQAAKLRFMTGGQVKVPIVFRCAMYYGRGLAAQHSDRPYPMFMNVPGLKIVCASTPADIKGILKASVRDDDPVVIFEDTKLWPVRGVVPADREYVVPIGKAEIKRPGNDITIVAFGSAMHWALEAAEELDRQGVSVEAIDLRTLKPLDKATILESVAKTGRLVVVENGHRIANVGSEIAAIVSEEGFDYLRRPIQRVCTPDVHIPFSPALEAGLYPDKDKIIAAVRRIL